MQLLVIILLMILHLTLHVLEGLRNLHSLAHGNLLLKLLLQTHMEGLELGTMLVLYGLWHLILRLFKRLGYLRHTVLRNHRQKLL